mgnify:CR=1 FL=1
MWVHIKGLRGGERSVQFQIDRQLPLSVFKTRFCKEHALQRCEWRFAFDGYTIEDEDTAERREIEEGDQIDLHWTRLPCYHRWRR